MQWIFRLGFFLILVSCNPLEQVQDATTEAEENVVDGGTAPAEISVVQTINILENTSSADISLYAKNITSAGKPCSSYISFTSTNYDVVNPYLISVWGKMPSCKFKIDPIFNANGIAYLTVKAASKTKSVTKNVLVNFIATNDPPSFPPILNYGMTESTLSAQTYIPAFNLNISDDSQLNCKNSVKVTSDNPTLFSEDSITISGDYNYQGCSLSLAPTIGEIGTAGITVEVDDGFSKFSRTFFVTVHNIIESPTISAPNEISIVEDTSSEEIVFITLDQDDLKNYAADITITSSNLDLIRSSDTSDIDIKADGNHYVATLKARSNQTGSTTLTVKITDPSSSNPKTTIEEKTIDLNVSAINDTPTISDIQDQNSLEDMTINALTFTIDDPDDSLDCSSSLSVSTSNSSVVEASSILFSGTAPNCNMSITPVTNATGSSVITITVSDGNSNSSDSFVVNFSGENDTPTMIPPSDIVINQDQGPIQYSFKISDSDSFITCPINVTASSSNTALLSNAKLSVSGGTIDCELTLETEANKSGKSVITLTVSDGITSNNYLVNLTVNIDESYTADDFTLSNTEHLEVINGSIRLKYTDTIHNSTEDFNHANATLENITYSNNFLTIDTTSASEELNSNWAPQWANLIANWKFNESFLVSMTVDQVQESRNALHGTPIDGIASTRLSRIGGYAISFLGGDGRVDLSNPASLNDLSLFSALVWINPSDYGEGGAGRIFDKNERFLYLDGTNNRLCFQQNFSTTNGLWCTLTNSLNAHWGDWFQVGLIYDSSSVSNSPSFYLNGEPVTSAALVSPVGTISSDAASSALIGSNNTQSADYNGLIDDLLLWNVNLNADEVKRVYLGQKSKFTGIYTSRVLDLGSVDDWTSLSLITPIPFSKELPNTSETSTHYSELETNSLLLSLEGLWHFNESALNSVIATHDFDDFSNNDLYANESGGVSLTSKGLFSGAISFDGTDDFLEVSDSNELDVNLTSRFTISVWYKVTEGDNGIDQTLFGKWNPTGNDRSYRCHLTFSTTNEIQCSVSSNGVTETSVEVLPTIDNRWHNLVFNYTGSQIHLYHDGELQQSKSYSSGVYNGTQNLEIGRSNLTDGEYFPGLIDEMAIWSRSLTSYEIRQLYRRGANRISYQVRSCDDAACLGETWQGPDGTSATYFSEIHNCLSPSADQCQSGPRSQNLDTLFSRYSGFATAPNARYFQYKLIMESDDSQDVCDNNDDNVFNEKCLPELSELSIEPDDHYYAGNPYVTLKSSARHSYTSITSITDTGSTLGVACQRYYQISEDGVNYSYFNSPNWLSATSIAESFYPNTLTSTNLSFFSAGELSIRVYFGATGNQGHCQLDQVDFTGTL
ncbi:MAG: LamG domain-containing protein [Bacteriovoracaceae bacterium]